MFNKGYRWKIVIKYDLFVRVVDVICYGSFGEGYLIILGLWKVLFLVYCVENVNELLVESL